MAYDLSIGTTARLVSGEFDYVLVAGDTLYYADTPNVGSSSNIGALATGDRISRAGGSWIVSAGVSYVQQVARSTPSSASTVNPVDGATPVFDEDTHRFTMSSVYGTATAGAVIHEADATVARPTGYVVVTWIGSVEPDNMLDNDIWLDTSP